MSGLGSRKPAKWEKRSRLTNSATIDQAARLIATGPDPNPQALVEALDAFEATDPTAADLWHVIAVMSMMAARMAMWSSESPLATIEAVRILTVHEYPDR